MKNCVDNYSYIRDLFSYNITKHYSLGNKVIFDIAFDFFKSNASLKLKTKTCKMALLNNKVEGLWFSKDQFDFMIRNSDLDEREDHQDEGLLFYYMSFKKTSEIALSDETINYMVENTAFSFNPILVSRLFSFFIVKNELNELNFDNELISKLIDSCCKTYKSTMLIIYESDSKNEFNVLKDQHWIKLFEKFKIFNLTDMNNISDLNMLIDRTVGIYIKNIKKLNLSEGDLLNYVKELNVGFLKNNIKLNSENANIINNVLLYGNLVENFDLKDGVVKTKL